MLETYHGHVRTPADAIILFEACRLGSLPRVQRRLSEKERLSIKSGSVFVWDEREAGMRRWTDGKSWSASRVSGSFLTYREMEGKRCGIHHVSSLGRAGRTPESIKGSDSDPDGGGEEAPDGYRYKLDGLMKQSFSITTSSGNHLHLISYYSRQMGIALQPSQDPALRHIRPPKGMYPESSINDQATIPAVTRTLMDTQPMSDIHPIAYQRQGGQIVYGPPPGVAWPLPGSIPQAFSPYPPTSAPTLQQFNQVPLTYHQPILASSSAGLGAVAAAFQNSRTLTPPIDSLTRLPHLVGNHHNASTGSYQNQSTNSRNLPHSFHSETLSNTSTLNTTDPRLIAPFPLSHGQILPGLLRDPIRSHTRTPSPPPLRDLSLTPTSRDTTLSSTSANTSIIPSIGTLVKDVIEHEARSRSASRSPSCQRGSNAPQDIPHSKIGFAGEDIRALRVLDKAFKT